MIQSRNIFFGAGLLSSVYIINNNQFFQNFFGREKKSQKTKVYIWGNGEYQARPDVGLQFKNFEPKLIDDFDKKNIYFQKIYFGEHHEAGIDQNGEFYIWDKKKLSSVKEAKNNDNQRTGLIKMGDNMKEIGFTAGFIWGLNKKGEVFSWPIAKEHNDYKEVTNVTIGLKPRKIKTLPNNIVSIQCGEDHFVALTKNGEVYTMGDDTYGQCGQGAEQRSPAPPFYDKRIRNPEKVENLPKIVKVICGHSHNLALSETGQLYGWGSNSQLQLSHEEQYSKIDEPLVAVYQPIRISHNLQDSIVTDIAAGENTSFLVTKNKNTGDCEVFACGYNLNGQLGTGYLKHVQDVDKIEGLSNYTIKTNKGTEENIDIKQISCGANHCMALLSVGAIMEWGQNEYGQLGNKKRAFSEHPIIMGKFKNENILNISCGYDSSAIVAELQEEQKK
ncbi:Regulator of chromosome condensation 1/beta-lactamase-inhibitor protein II [Pseudocohnilembus persalinus]|uniref:Regulator of chromosome condensation 1/beta-lactamase-inhibitor protein II n=1 Tax=Pseudocohnilembus persalinus TaxID=266149 RepID=A0A0V0QB40_PSEPJ|nr:Regulator of chromosome condensation 1/beta-lactamase-inhibitor protein II [Pseudocohnilembus persalinus]|eukprot:KRW99370.1 Regulator of chromosome condensation 1/beta-lactamase-inhibitor protein II [Pseudocohnilembus persalinus]